MHAEARTTPFEALQHATWTPRQQELSILIRTKQAECYSLIRPTTQNLIIITVTYFHEMEDIQNVYWFKKFYFFRWKVRPVSGLKFMANWFRLIVYTWYLHNCMKIRRQWMRKSLRSVFLQYSFVKATPKHWLNDCRCCLRDALLSKKCSFF